jgi:hypothetical protein
MNIYAARLQKPFLQPQPTLLISFSEHRNVLSMADMSGQFYRRLEFPCKQSSGVKTASTDVVVLNDNDSELEDGEIRYENFPRSDPRNKHNLHYHYDYEL